ncbi:MAG: phosphatase PAP2 family protein [Hyphomicrobiaceae bacterium]
MTSFFDQYVQPVADFVAHHPLLGSVIVFLLALSESLPVIGAVSPGTATILAISALAGLGYMPVWAVLAAALLGAIVGDGLAFWFGHRYKAHALEMWPLSRYPKMIESSQAFFHRHGGKSILIARFTPVVRAFVPLIAGISGMSPARFYSANVGSAVVWAFSHILPAAAAGASLGVLHQISGRLVALVVALLAVSILMSVVMRRGLQWGSDAFVAAQRRAHAALEGRHGRLAEILRELTQPEVGAAREVAFLGAILALALVLLFNLIEDVLARGELMRADHAISTLVGSWRTAWGDSLMVAITALGDTPVTAFVALLAAGWIFWKGDRRMSLGLVAAIAVTAMFVVGLKATMQVPRPSILYTGADAFSFPSGHTTFAAALYGILGWIWSRDLERPWKVLVIAGTASLVAAIALSRVYLQAHWPSDVATGLVFGFGITAAFALAFRGADMSRLELPRLLALSVLAFMTVGAWHVLASHEKAMRMYAPQAQSRPMTTDEWRQSGWRELPAHRVDVGGENEEPIILQWSGTITELKNALAPHGWQPAVGVGLATAGAYLHGSTTATQLPVLPRLNDGRAPDLSLVRPARVGGERELLHVWVSNVVLSDRDARPILVGALLFDRLSHPLPFLTLPTRTAASPADAIAKLADVLPGTLQVTSPASAPHLSPVSVLLAGP